MDSVVLADRRRATFFEGVEYTDRESFVHQAGDFVAWCPVELVYFVV
jgi:hypothetical protein